MAFGAEDAVDPSVFMGREAHIVDVGGGDYIFGQHDGIVPQAEVVHAIGTFGYGEEGFAVGAFHAQHQQVAALPCAP